MSISTPITSRDWVTGQSVRSFSFLGNHGVRLAATRRESTVQAAALVAFAHGYTAFTGAYIEVLRTLAANGLIVYALDHRGHGYSEGVRGSLDRLDDMVDDFEQLVAIARCEEPELPLFTLGHSMGGLLVARHAIRFQEGLAGVIPVSAALVVGDHVSDAEVKLLMMASHIAPQLPAIGEEEVVGADTDSPDREKWRNFLSYRGKVRLNMARELYLGGQDTLERVSEWTLPILLQHGTSDPVTKPVGSEAAFERASSQDRTLELWAERLHNLLTDDGWQEPVQHIVEWIGKRANGQEGKWAKC